MMKVERLRVGEQSSGLLLNVKWELAPAYDLTRCTEGYNGEHATSVNGTGHPTLKDFIAVGTKIKMNERRCREIIDEVSVSCNVFAFMFSASRSNNGVTWFENAGDVIDESSFEVFQVISEDAALVHGKSEYGSYFGAVYLLTNGDGKYYYDDEIVKVPDGKVVRQVGIYQYQTKSEFGKTVPIIQIMNK